MTSTETNTQRRTLLQAAAVIAAAGQVGMSSAHAAQAGPAANGKAGDFDFLSGHWKIQNRQRKNKVWDQFEGEATVVGILGGLVSVEELRIPARNLSGMGLRTLDLERKLWADYWLNSRNGMLSPAPTLGGFADGVGTWDAADVDGGTAIIVRGVWDQITPTSCRWRQAVSRDEGRTWEENWIMQWARAGAR